MKPYRDFMRSPPVRPAIVAHRGDWRSTSENTIASIERAIAQGYEIVEIDVQQSADGVLFLLHDDDLNRMAGRNEMASNLSVEVLRDIRLRPADGSGDAPGTYPIPTLREALRAARSRVYLDVDVKHPHLMEATAALIAAEGMSDQVDIKIDVHSRAEADHLLELEAEYGVMVMPKTRFSADTIEYLIGLLQTLDVSVVEAEFDDLTTIARNADRFVAAGISLWVNTLDPVACCDLTDRRAITDPASVWGALLSAGVSVIQTDEPAALADFRASKIAAE